MSVDASNAVVEFAFCPVRSGQEGDFVQAMKDCLPLFQQARGCLGMKCYRSLDRSSVFIVVVTWRELDDHRIHFRQSASFTDFNERVSPFLDGEVTLEYSNPIAVGF